MNRVAPMSHFVQSVIGPVSVDELGPTLMHETMSLSGSGWQLDPTIRFDRDAELGKAINQVLKVRAQGIRTIVDPSSMDARDAGFIRDVAVAADVNIICGTGLFVENRINRDTASSSTFTNFGYTCYFTMLSLERLTQVYEAEITTGISGDSGVRAGMIMAANAMDSISPGEEKSIRAAARAAKRQDVRVYTYLTPNADIGLRQQQLFKEEGLPLHHVMQGGCDMNTNLDYHRVLAEHGVYLGFDRIGAEFICPDEVRVRTLVNLIKDGFVDQLLLSQDAYPSSHLGYEDMPPAWRTNMQLPSRQMTYLFDEFIPRLQREGVSDSEIETMTVTNPQRFFSGSPL
jgi:phosphotriesterase-related protein